MIIALNWKGADDQITNNQMTTILGKQIFHNGWKAAGITDALNNKTDGLESLDLFHDIDPMMEKAQKHGNLTLQSYTEAISHYSQQYSREDKNNDDESDWEAEGNSNEFDRNISDAFDDIGSSIYIQGTKTKFSIFLF